jgi:hypothetical protein
MGNKILDTDSEILKSFGFKESDINLLKSVTSQISLLERKSFDRLNNSKKVSIREIAKIDNRIIRDILSNLSRDIPTGTVRIRIKFLIKKILNDGLKFDLKFFDRSSHWNSKTGKEKIKYLTKKDADSHILNIKNRESDCKLNSYTCLYCGQIHIGNL